MLSNIWFIEEKSLEMNTPKSSGVWAGKGNAEL
jgi:hypothetical protein